VSSCFARPTPGIEPVMSFPIDETMYGVYDISGSMSEWLDDWWLEDRGLRRHAGGSWADGGPADMFGIEGGSGKLPDETSCSVGFRLILTMP
jgi:formylglycine-generating enzyme required for sulfatase activity